MCPVLRTQERLIKNGRKFMPYFAGQTRCLRDNSAQNTLVFLRDHALVSEAINKCLAEDTSHISAHFFLSSTED